MKINIRVVPKAKQNKIIEADDNLLKIYLTAVPEKGKANEAIIKMLSKHFHTAKSNIKIIKGSAKKDKIIEIC